jgi:hypothetical protein
MASEELISDEEDELMPSVTEPVVLLQAERRSAERRRVEDASAVLRMKMWEG